VHRPGTLEEVRVVTAAFQQHYNEQRPHQGRACGNRPPRVACPDLPRLPPLPTTVQPARWLQPFHQQAGCRARSAPMAVSWSTCRPPLSPNASPAGRSRWWWMRKTRCFAVWQGTVLFTRLAIKGRLHVEEMPFEESIQVMQREARSQVQRHTFQRRVVYQRSLWA
jgi:hypothetical protein